MKSQLLLIFKGFDDFFYFFLFYFLILALLSIGFIIYFNLFSIKLSQSYDLDREFYELAMLTWIIFYLFFNYFFQLHPLKLG